MEIADTFEDKVDALYKELEFAFQYQRPSILLVTYKHESTRRKAALSLEERLSGVNHPLIRIQVNEKRFDIPMILSRHRARGTAVFSVPHLSRGGGMEKANTYRALNIRREFLVDYRLRVVFWLNQDETVALSRHAPDFWAFRHLVVAFDQLNDQRDFQD
jgi:hypothetical protein